ncbi:MAG: hypothetical protein ACYTFI_06270 [Planctomycetota bacterium]
MELDNLKMPTLNTTLMGVLRGVLDYWGVQTSTPTIYGGSGHAFLINIHEGLCPSGPYCWKREEFVRLIRNLGVERTDLGFFSKDASAEERRKLEAALKGHLDAGTPCSLLNMENQLITGYDETGFFTAQPWAPKVNFPPGRLTFGSWKEFGDEIHVDFYSYGRLDPADEGTVVADSLEHAVDLWKNPTKHTSEPYGVGPDAYDKWIGAVKEGRGSSHGNWWNAMVWSECRSMAARYFAEICEKLPSVASQAAGLSEMYGAVAEELAKASDKEMASEEKGRLLEDARAKEEKCIQETAGLRAAL